MKIEWSETALANRKSIFRFISSDNPRAAIALDERFRNLAAKLKAFPHLGRPGRVEGTREFVAHKNYILIYELDGGIVRILRVLHAARLWPPD